MVQDISDESVSESGKIFLYDIRKNNILGLEWNLA